LSKALAVVFWACCGVTLALADDCPYAEYRFLMTAKQIEITTGFMERRSDAAARTSELERQGIVILESSTGHTFTKKEHVGTHQVETTIHVAPPVGHGEGGASSNVDLRVVMDGVPLVDCPLSYAFMGLDRIAIDPARRFVTLNGYYGILRFDGFESKKLVDSDWLTERAKAVEALIIKGPSRLH
jgi:hypothetical protein